MQEKNKSVFFCDIYGTFKNSHTSQEERANDLHKFLENLSFLDEEVILCFFSTSNYDDVKECVDEIKNILPSNIVIGPYCGNDSHPEDDKYIKSESKIDFLRLYAKHLNNSFEINNFYVADDSFMNLKLAEINLKSYNYELFQTNSEENIKSLNKMLEEYIMEKVETKIHK